MFCLLAIQLWAARLNYHGVVILRDFESRSWKVCSLMASTIVILPVIPCEDSLGRSFKCEWRIITLQQKCSLSWLSLYMLFFSFVEKKSLGACFPACLIQQSHNRFLPPLSGKKKKSHNQSQLACVPLNFPYPFYVLRTPFALLCCLFKMHIKSKMLASFILPILQTISDGESLFCPSSQNK